MRSLRAKKMGSSKLNYVSYIFIFLISCAILFPICLSAEGLSKKPKAVFLSPSVETSQFFGPLTRFMKVAADNLDIDLEVVYSMRSHIKMIQNGKNILSRDELPDYLILVNERNVIPGIIEEADKKSVKTILFNEGLILDDEKRFLSGQWKLNSFIGQILPNDYQSGKLLAEELFKQAIIKNLYADDGKIHIIGINGTRKTASPILRGQGLMDAISENKNIVLHQIVHAYWEQEKAKSMSVNLLRRYPNTRVIWAASDLMALGAAQGIDEAGKKAGVDILTGGIDWAPFVFDTVQSGALSASVGGHIFDGAWVMVMIYDHFNKAIKTFKSEKTDFFVLTPTTVERYRKITDESVWNQIDFKRFSKSENPNIISYDFGVGLILNSWDKKVK